VLFRVLHFFKNLSHRSTVLKTISLEYLTFLDPTVTCGTAGRLRVLVSRQKTVP
jgi:hypothetical protein